MLNVTRFTALFVIATAVLVTSCEIGAPEDFQTVEENEKIQYSEELIKKNEITLPELQNRRNGEIYDFHPQ